MNTDGVGKARPEPQDSAHAVLSRSCPSNLSDAYVYQADLSEAEGISNEKLEQQAGFLGGTTMPNGQKYEDWLKDKEG